ncbi:MAG: biopolymer transporter Tol [Ignavibacteria bacterium]|nr:biopolymer transporter Tol [Ignavibacteria bacterium]
MTNDKLQITVICYWLFVILASLKTKSLSFNISDNLRNLRETVSRRLRRCSRKFFFGVFISNIFLLLLFIFNNRANKRANNILLYALCSLLLLSSSNLYSQFDDFYHPELEWKTIETKHFFVHYHTGTERTAKTIAKIAEEIYVPITSLYHHEPDQKISFVVKDFDDYANGAAYFYDNKIEIWATSLDFDLRGSHNWLRNVVTHEFTHIIQIQTAMKFGRKVPAFYFQWLGYEEERRNDVLYGFPNVIASYPISGFIVPSWFAEGVAQYNRPELSYDKWDAHRDMILRMYALDSNMLTWNEMSVFGKTSLGNESSYNAGFNFVRYISEKYGQDVVERISRSLSKFSTITIDKAIEDATGKNGEEVYNEWKQHLQSSYGERTEALRQQLVEGKIITDVGFGNFYPQFSPDGGMLAYISNKEADYFGLSSFYLYDVDKKEEKLLVSGVRSNFSWFPDGKKIIYSKTTSDNKHWSKQHDLYVYDIEKEDETRFSYGWRANSPSVSPDGKMIAFVAGSDGTINLYTSDSDGKNFKRRTNYSNGEQVYNPKWSPDGKKILFDYSIKDGRDVAVLNVENDSLEFLFATSFDERNAVFSPDGHKIIFACDKTGIFNLYEYNFETKSTTQLTNVLGGAFMPSVNEKNQLAFASYTSSGYKISWFDSLQNISAENNSYVKEENKSSSFLLALKEKSANIDWEKIRSFDDANLSEPKSRTYKNIFTSMTFYPFFRFDNYSEKASGISLIKPGVYFVSNDVLDKYGLFGGAAINTRLERDLFFIFEYRDKIPLFFQLGMDPILSLEAYNISRTTEFTAILRPDNPIPLDLDVSFNLIEFDVVLKQKLFSENLGCELRYTHSRYASGIETFLFDDPDDGVFDPISIPGSREEYYVGNVLSLRWDYKAIALSRFMEINPSGRKIFLQYDYEFSKFNPEYVIEKGELVRVFEEPKFQRVELKWNEYTSLPGWKHTLATLIRAGKIIGGVQDDFFDFYLGGLVGMKGYPYYAIGGNSIAAINATYRFPMWENMDIRVAHLYFDKLYGAVFFDAGNAWTTGSIKQQKFQRDIGGELRLDAFSWYAFPTRIFFTAAYGLDEFQRMTRNNKLVTYGKEWRFYFGILFGFDFD